MVFIQADGRVLTLCFAPEFEKFPAFSLLAGNLAGKVFAEDSAHLRTQALDSIHIL
jgi:hypothetical protein